ncbi:hypothetical protein GQ457_14G015590 [Hibiscus cannabinus]
MKMQQYLEVVLKQLRSQRPRIYQGRKEGRIKVKVKDLKPKRIKDYLEYKFSQRRFRPNIINRSMISIVREENERRNLVYHQPLCSKSSTRRRLALL